MTGEWLVGVETLQYRLQNHTVCRGNHQVNMISQSVNYVLPQLLLCTTWQQEEQSRHWK